MREWRPRRTIGCTSRNGGIPPIRCGQGILGGSANPGAGVESADRDDTGIHKFTVVFLHGRIQTEVISTDSKPYLELLPWPPIVQCSSLDNLIRKYS